MGKAEENGQAVTQLCHRPPHENDRCLKEPHDLRLDETLGSSLMLKIHRGVSQFFSALFSFPPDGSLRRSVCQIGDFPPKIYRVEAVLGIGYPDTYLRGGRVGTRPEWGYLGRYLDS
jgi:hypothetical protein